MATSNTVTPSGILEVVKSLLLIGAVGFSSLGGFILCFSHKLFGAPSNLIFTGIGFLAVFGLIWVYQEGREFPNKMKRLLSASGVAVTVTATPTATATLKLEPQDTGEQRKWQTDAAADAAPKNKPEPYQPKLAIPRTKQPPARIGGEWEDE